jgi:hypothetical protein
VERAFLVHLLVHLVAIARRQRARDDSSQRDY